MGRQGDGEGNLLVGFYWHYKFQIILPLNLNHFHVFNRGIPSIRNNLTEPDFFVALDYRISE
jgi:hypothetical protein